MIVCAWKDILKYAPLLPGVEEAYHAVNALTDYENGKVTALSGGNRFFVAAQSTIAPGLAEAHRRYLDIQYIVKGQETVGWADLASCRVAEEFNEEKDIGMYDGPFSYMTIREGMCYVAFPEDAHMPGRHLEVPNDFVKIVVKLRVD